LNFKFNFTFALVFTLKQSFKAKAREAKAVMMAGSQINKKI